MYVKCSMTNLFFILFHNKEQSRQATKTHDWKVNSIYLYNKLTSDN